MAGSPPGASSVELTAEEADLLLRICKQYRSTLPIYLQSAEDETRLIESIVRKISASSR